MYQIVARYDQICPRGKKNWALGSQIVWSTSMRTSTSACEHEHVIRKSACAHVVVVTRLKD